MIKAALLRLTLMVFLVGVLVGQLWVPGRSVKAAQPAPARLKVVPCEAVYPMIVYEDNLPPISGPIIDILNGYSDEGGVGINHKGWLAWDPQFLDSNALIYELQFPRLALTAYTNPSDSGDHIPGVGDYVKSLPGNNSGVGTEVAMLEGQEIIVPVWGSFSAAMEAYHISGFIRVKIIPGGVDLTGSDPTVLAVYLGPAAFNLCPELALSKSGPVTATVGSPITYTLSVTNSGVVSVTNMVITDALPAGANYVKGGELAGGVVSWTVPSLAAGKSLTRTFTVTASQTISNSLYRVSAEGAISATGQIEVVTVVEPILNPGPPVLVIGKRGPVTATAGSLITYTLTVTNSGELSATNLIISDTVPTGASYVGGGSFSGGVVRWLVASLAADKSLSRSFTVTASETITNSLYGVSAEGGIGATGQVGVVTSVHGERARTVYVPVILK